MKNVVQSIGVIKIVSYMMFNHKRNSSSSLIEASRYLSHSRLVKYERNISFIDEKQRGDHAGWVELHRKIHSIDRDQVDSSSRETSLCHQNLIGCP